MYKCKIYKGDYTARQQQANADGAVCYFEQHFNSVEDPKAGYMMALITDTASEKTKKWAMLYTSILKTAFDVPCKGTIVIKKSDRGYGNLSGTTMPAILAEPLFVSNPAHVSMLLDGGIEKLAKAIKQSVQLHFPEGGLIGFSVGHLYKKSRPNDTGAAVAGHPELSEGELARQVIERVIELLEDKTEYDTIKIVKNDKLVQQMKVKAGAKVTWDEKQKKVYIYE